MKGRLLNLSTGINGRQQIIIEIETDFKEGFEVLRTADIELNIRKWRPRRSKDANAYFHAIVTQIAEVRGVSNDEIKKQLVVDYGSLARDKNNEIVGLKLPVGVDIDDIYPYTRCFKQVTEGGKLFNCFLVFKRSSAMDSKEMSRLIDGAVEEARALGIDTDTPAERARWAGLDKEE